MRAGPTPTSALASRRTVQNVSQADAHSRSADGRRIARGGGALEDLLPFNSEELVRAVAAAATPVVSAIGHEADRPLLDDVADLRASTPTDAAKRIVPEVSEELAGVRPARDEHQLADPLLAERLDRVRDHRPVVQRQQVLVRDPRQRMQAGARAPREDDAFHGRQPNGRLRACYGWTGMMRSTTVKVAASAASNLMA